MFIKNWSAQEHVYKASKIDAGFLIAGVPCMIEGDQAVFYLCPACLRDAAGITLEKREDGQVIVSA